MDLKRFFTSIFKVNKGNSEGISRATTPPTNFERLGFNITNQGISDIIEKVPQEYLEELVCRYFLIILGNSYACDYRYFSMYPSWQNLLLENIDIALLQIDYPENFKTIIKILPEHESALYNELMKCFIENEFRDFARSHFSIPEDILIPLAYLEKYCETPALNVRKCIKEILSATYTFKEFYETINVLENYFDVSYSDMKQSIDEILKEEVDMWINKERNMDDIGILEEFFASNEAYDLFMENISQILHSQGIELYAYLLKIIGPIKELVENEYACFEYET